jgi:stearoyl-CoA desaturase (delta-9 desaturase)
MIFHEHREARVDASDLQHDPVVQWQHHFYFPLLVLTGYLIPTFIPGLCWNDWKGGFFYAAMLRSTLVHHVRWLALTALSFFSDSFHIQSTFCINSVAHYLGHAPYDDKLSPRDHFLSALLTLGEGYHNFHHQFPMDYRNAFRWYQYDPTKWFIGLCNVLGLASHLRVFPSNEIEKGVLSMKIKTLKNVQDSLVWPPPPEQLPIVNWETCEHELFSTGHDQLLSSQARFSNTYPYSCFGVYPRRFCLRRTAPWRSLFTHSQFWFRHDGRLLRWRVRPLTCGT